MDNSSGSLTNVCKKKSKRLQSKKRKVEALLNLFDNDKSILPKTKKQKVESLSDSYKALKDELKKFIKKPDVEPCFYLTHLGSKAAIDFQNDSSTKNTSFVPICMEDIYHLLLRSVIGHFSTQPMEWAKLEQPQNIRKTVLLVISGLSETEVTGNMDKLDSLKKNFRHIVKCISPNISFAEELSTVHLITDFHIQSPDAYSTLFPSEREVKVRPVDQGASLSKVHLLLSPVQLVMENFPLPQSVFQYSKSHNYVFSKKEYSEVTAKSPMFAVDCEMCLTEKGLSELTRIAIVDEDLQTVYHSFVKPKARITDYVTRYSGIMAESLKNVETSLSDVQSHLQNMLPSDAILCGQSLNNDLHALRMIHPYVIDTSIIFNNSGIRSKKNSLKSLAKLHLNETIQCGKVGHNPVEDALATMKLVQLKLENSVQYGDACFSFADSTESDTRKGKEGLVTNLSSTTFSPKEGGFFQQAEKHSKKVCLIGDENSLKEYWSEVLTDNVQKICKNTNKKVVKTLSKHIPDFDLLIGHLTCQAGTISAFLEFFNDLIKDQFSSLDPRTFFSIHISGVNESQYDDIKNGLFMATIKKT